ncbi:MAG: endogenous inhibitor of DNA gyrase (YacG/DUF329 family) [Candidatus Azotimanducaceae bacterium]|jgi:endogenous inhibitor of DNA gyrase (YacG/DUF329 family)
MKKLTVNCPICEKEIVWSPENLYRPFCSERCKTIDLGDWADGKRFIPSDAEHDDVTQSDLDNGER